MASIRRSPSSPEDTKASFTVELPAGPAMLLSTLVRPNGQTSGAYYVKVELVD